MIDEERMLVFQNSVITLPINKMLVEVRHANSVIRFHNLHPHIMEVLDIIMFILELAGQKQWSSVHVVQCKIRFTWS
jgi:hypothetical protein